MSPLPIEGFKGTPGPLQIVENEVWDTRADGEPGIPLIRLDTGICRSWGRKLDTAEMLANLHLYKAAPDLLRVAGMVVEAAELSGLTYGPLAQAASAAISRALGKDQ